VKLEQEDPFALYPGELWDKQVKNLQIVPVNSALRLKATRDVEDKENNCQRRTGEEWWFYGPGTYYPQVGVEEVQLVKALVIQPGQAIHLRATLDFVDRTSQQRYVGDVWHYGNPGAFIPAINEQVLSGSVIQPIVLTDTVALHMKAVQQFTDENEKERYPGDEWLVTRKQTETYIPHVHATKVKEVNITSLNRRQYAVILDPVNPETGKPDYGKKIMRRGECSFFIQPGETLDKIYDVNILTAENALWVLAKEPFVDTTTVPGSKISRKAGEKWIIVGPKEYLPPLQVDILGQANYRQNQITDIGRHVLVGLAVLCSVWWLF